MNKINILALIASICLLIKLIFGIEVGTGEQDIIANGVLALVSIVGVVRDPKKKGNQ